MSFVFPPSKRVANDRIGSSSWAIYCPDPSSTPGYIFFFVLPRFIEGVMEGNNGVWERGLDEGKKVGNRECVM